MTIPKREDQQAKNPLVQLVDDLILRAQSAALAPEHGEVGDGQDQEEALALARAALLAALPPAYLTHLAHPTLAPTHQHIKSGGKYREIARGFLQTATPVGDMTELVAYVGESGKIWFRPPSEFDDDERFARTATGEQQ